MKKIIIVFFFSALFTSCTKHFIQIYDIGSAHVKQKDGSYVFENDTLRITYSFWESKGLMSLAVYNKLSKPIYIDWKNSSFVFNGHKLNYWTEENRELPSGTLYGFHHNGPLNELRTTMNEGLPTYSSSLLTNEKVTFIPPKSYYDRSQFYLMPVNHCELNVNCQSSIVPRNDSPEKKTVVYGHDFSSENSPLRFRNYIAFSTSQNTQELFFVDNEFYLASVKEMDIRHYRGKRKGYDAEGGHTVYENPFKKNTSFYIKLESYYYSVEMRK